MGGGGGGSRGVNAMRMCGEDQRLRTPAVLYSDSGMATIIYKLGLVIPRRALQGTRPLPFPSPGYPGLYPPNSRCRYLIMMSSPATTGTIKFLAMDLPQERCATDYLAIYSVTSTSSPLITTICGDDARTIQFKGPNVLVDFSTGTFLPPYKFSGFHATVDFVDVLGNPQVPPPTPPPPPDSTHIMSEYRAGGS
ncbi:uncharacterized protein LOC135224265 [Macrobrachium nipponense]|uniref:uncharacterized protein LOC135224265 n=1 Tax=Macrobrachium nipponense TaxID=159736 RepID=UPI0030C811E3